MNKEIWVENPGTLFSSLQVVPTTKMYLAEQINALTRLVIIIYVIMLLFDFKFSIHFLIISLLVLIILYYIQRNNMQPETYEYYGDTFKQAYTNSVNTQPAVPYPLSSLATTTRNVIDGKEYETTSIATPEELAFCGDFVGTDTPNNQLTGLNQRLAYLPDYKNNPVTQINPVVIPPTHALDYWKENDFVVFSKINSSGIQQDNYLSGYAVSTCCGALPDGAKRVPQTKEACCGNTVIYQPKKKTIEKYTQKCGQVVSPVLAEYNPQYNSLPVPENYEAPRKERYTQKCGQVVSPVLAEYNPQYNSLPVPENYEAPSYRVMPDGPGMINMECGYNPEQVRNNLPSNLPVGNCPQNEKFKQYNKNLFTQIVTPGVYTMNQVNEPINSNIGISFNQQFEPTTQYRDESGLHYLQHDPRIIEPAEMNEQSNEVEEYARYDNVYDPRFYGYGTSYRSYSEPMVGQTRFMYDDINAIKMPNYVVRSKIDHLPYADQYGPMKEGEEMGNVHNPNIRQLVQDEWMRNSLQFRDDLSERRMRKINSEAWQRKQAPLGPRQV
jgi:hypothetical protein